MIKRLSLVTSGLLLSSTLAFSADAKVSGSVMAYTYMEDNADLTTVSSSLSAEKTLAKNISAKLSYNTTSVVDADDRSGIAVESLLSEANVTYATKDFALTLGRQAIDLEWMGDYHEAAVGSISSIPDTSIVLGLSKKNAAIDEDESSTFSNTNTDKGAYVLDVKYSGVKGLELNPYFYTAADVASYYGLKATYTDDMFGAMAHFAASSEDVATTEDGSLMALELSTSVSEVSLSAGYISTDKEGGLASLSSFGDNYSPFDDGSNLGGVDSSAYYLTAGTSVSGIDIGGLYGVVDYGSSEDKEFNLSLGYSITDSLAASALYVDISGDTEKDYASLSLAYSF
jgi:hypothetical protein